MNQSGGGSICPACGAQQVGSTSTICQVCGTNRVGGGVPFSQKIQISLETLQNLKLRGLIDPADFQRIREVLLTEKERISTPPPLRKSANIPEAGQVVSPPTFQSGPSPVAGEVFKTPSSEQPSSPRLETVQESSAPSGPPSPSFGDVLSRFLEERNIRWGEVIGGLLVVGCSIALVVSLWSEIAERPFLKYGIFTSIIAALFAAGFYMEQKWKLTSSSRGMLIVSTLLVPLNFLALAAFSQGTEQWNILAISSEVLALGIFFLLIRKAASLISPGWRNQLPAAVVTLSACTLFMGELSGPWPEMNSIRFFILALAPVMVFSVMTFLMGQRVSRNSENAGKFHGSLLVTFGIITFATFLSEYFLLRTVGNAEWSAPLISILLPPAGVAVIHLALSLKEKLSTHADENQRTAALALAIAGAFLVLFSLKLAWPHPDKLFACCILCMGVFLWMANRFHMIEAHYAAIFALLLGSGVASFILKGDIRWDSANSSQLLKLFFSVAGAKTYCVMTVLLFCISIALFRSGRRETAWSYEIAGYVVVGVSTILLSLHGWVRPGDPHSLVTFLSYSFVVFLIGAMFRDSTKFASAALFILFLLISQIVVTRMTVSSSWLVAFLVFSTILAVAGLFPDSIRRKFSNPLKVFLVLSLPVTGLLLLNHLEQYWPRVSGGHALWFSSIFLLLSLQLRSDKIFQLFQVLLAGSILLMVSSILQRHGMGKPWMKLEGLVLYQFSLGIQALAWLLIESGTRFLKPSNQQDNSRLSWFQSSLASSIPFLIAVAFCSLLVLSGDMLLFLVQNNRQLHFKSLGNIYAWLGLATSFGSYWLHIHGRKFNLNLFGLILLLGTSIFSYQFSGEVENLKVMHALQIGVTACAALFLAGLWVAVSAGNRNGPGGNWCSSFQNGTEFWIYLYAVLGVLFALRSYDHSAPEQDWLHFVLLPFAVIFVLISLLKKRTVHLYASTLLILISFNEWRSRQHGHGLFSSLDWVESNLLLLSILGILWFLIHLILLRSVKKEPQFKTHVAPHLVLGVISLVVAILMIGAEWAMDAGTLHRNRVADPFSWAVSMIMLLQWILLLLERPRIAACGLYLFGLFLVGNIFLSLNRHGNALIASSMAVGSFYVLMVCIFWKWKHLMIEGIFRMQASLNIPGRAEIQGGNWVVHLSHALMVWLAILGLHIHFTSMNGIERMLVPLSLLASAMGCWTLHSRTKSAADRNLCFILLFLVINTLAGMWIVPGIESELLHRLLALHVGTFAYLILLKFVTVGSRVSELWKAASKSFVPMAISAGIATLLMIFPMEFKHSFSPPGMQLHPAANLIFMLCLGAEGLFVFLWVLKSSSLPEHLQAWFHQPW